MMTIDLTYTGPVQRTRRIRSTLLAALSLCAWLYPSSEVRAGTCGLDRGGCFLGFESGRLPPNAAGLLWESDSGGQLPPGLDAGCGPQLTITDRADGVELPVEAIHFRYDAFSETATAQLLANRIAPQGRVREVTSDYDRLGLWAIRPEGGFRPGHTYVFRYDPDPRVVDERLPRGGEHPGSYPRSLRARPVEEIEIAIDDAPIGGGFEAHLRVGRPEWVPTFSSESQVCPSGSEYTRAVEIEFVLPEHLAPYAPYLHLETYVDGARQHRRRGACARSSRGGESTAAPASDRLRSLDFFDERLRLRTMYSKPKRVPTNAESGGWAVSPDSDGSDDRRSVRASMTAQLPGTSIFITSGEHVVFFDD